MVLVVLVVRFFICGVAVKFLSKSVFFTRRDLKLPNRGNLREKMVHLRRSTRQNPMGNTLT